MTQARTLFALGAALLFTCLGGPAGAQETAPTNAPRLRIVSPTPNEYVTGAVRIEAELLPADASRNVVFYVDGAPVCTLARAPYVCNWDAGASVVEHQIRVVANLVGGGRTVATLLTKKLDFAEAVNVNVVQVTATVTDGRRYVTGLPQTAFHVFEDGKPQAISHFDSEHVPLNLTVAVDISSSMMPSLAKLKTAVKELLKAVPANDHLTLIAFNDKIFTVSEDQKDPAQAEQAIDALSAWGFTSLYDVIIRGAELADRETGRKAIIVFTDGEDEGSHARLDDVERRLETTDMTLYMIGQGRGTTFNNLKAIMTKLAEPSGGRAIFTERIDELHDAFGTLLDELSSQYLLGYVPTNARRDGTVREITVKVDGHHVRARQAYRAPSGG